MGLIVPQTVKIKISRRTCKYCREKGYKFEKYGDFIEVDVFDLHPGSRRMVKVICDVCGKEIEIQYRFIVKNNKENKLIICGSNSCRNKKYEVTCAKKYGKGIINAFQAEEVKEKIKNTNLERYGYAYSLQSEEIRNKGIQTLQEKYGENIVSPGQVEEIKNKILNSFQFNHTGPSSRAQRYINHILNGTLNKRICGSLADIYIEKENIIIEHDGSGHFLGDTMNGNKTPTKESLLYEKEREDKIINNGYRMIRFIANKDRIPSDEVILNLIEGFKNSDFKVIRINFEEGTIDRDYEEKWYCNFGKLRKITKEDLEQFEKQEENTSEN